MCSEHLESLVTTADREPYEYYERLRATGDVVWDEGLQSWLATTHNACKGLMRNDEALFSHPDICSPAEIRVAGGRQLKLLRGEEHLRVHRWYMRLLSPKVVDAWRPTRIRPIVDLVMDRFIDRGRVELVSELADEVPIRTVAALADLPWEDDGWIDRTRKRMETLSAFFSSTLQRTEEVDRQALAAVAELNDMLRPFVEARRDGAGEDLISLFWREGPALLDNWGIDDVLINTRQLFFNGSATSAFAIANALYLLLTRPDLAAEVRGGDERMLAVFIEEVLRLYGVAHFRPRRVTVDTTFHGVPIKRGQVATAVLAAANRDPGKYERPDQVDLHRRAPRDHLAFNFGPRVCVGAALARAIMHETLAAVLRRLPDMQLDPAAEPPAFYGFMSRSFRPLHVLFTPVQPTPGGG